MRLKIIVSGPAESDPDAAIARIADILEAQLGLKIQKRQFRLSDEPGKSGKRSGDRAKRAEVRFWLLGE